MKGPPFVFVTPGASCRRRLSEMLLQSALAVTILVSSTSKALTLRLLMSYIYIYMEHLFLMFLDHTQRRSTVGRTPLDE